jgi:hypothetical protein
MAAQPVARNRVEEAIERLVEEFRGRYSSESIRDLVSASFDAYKGSRVTDFVPLLVYRSARAQLGGLARTDAATRTGTQAE